MSNKVEITKEIMKLAQHRVREVGTPLIDEIARNIAQEAILNVDEQAEILINDEEAYSNEDALVAAFAVNDIVVNEARFDVRVSDDDNQVSISRALIGTNYLKNGTLVVKMSDNFTGAIVAHIGEAQWISIDKNTHDQSQASIKVIPDANFNLIEIINQAKKNINAIASKAPNSSELTTFVASKSELILARQRQIVESTLANKQIWTDLNQVISLWSKAKVRKVLSSEANLRSRIDKLSNILAPKFSRLNKEQITQIIAQTGEIYGGQPESPVFRKALLSLLTKEELSASLGGQVLAKATQFAEEILSGRQAIDAIKDFVKNKVAVDLALTIKQQRQELSGFMSASAEELSSAFQQLALQPAYATHSQDPSEGIESINEALNLLTAADLAESIKNLEEEMTQL